MILWRDYGPASVRDMFRWSGDSLEGFQTAQQKMIMVLTSTPDIDGNAQIWTSDKGTFQAPVWNQVGGAAKQITGRESRLFVVNSGDLIWATTANTGFKDGSWTNIPGHLKQLSRDRFSVCGTNSVNALYCMDKDIEFTNAWKFIAGDVKWVSISNGRMITVQSNDDMMYYNNTIQTYINVQDIQRGTTIERRRAKMAVLNDIAPNQVGVVMLDEEGLVYATDLTKILGADGRLTGKPTWFQVPTATANKARYIHMNMGRIIYIDTNNKIYYTEDYRRPNWVEVRPPPMNQVYNTMNERGEWYTFTKADAQAQCARYGGTLASSAQLANAYKNGANWCACGWTTDAGTQYPITTQLIGGCGGTEPGVRTCGPDNNVTRGNATCFGIKPAAGTPGVFGFNESSWNAPFTSVELATFSSVPRICGNDGVISTYKGARFRYYSRDECTALGTRLMESGDARVTDYNAGNGECTIVNRTTGARESASARTCVEVQDRPNQDTTYLWDDGSTGNCIFNAAKYKEKYQGFLPELAKMDIGQLYEHWLTVGLEKGYSPCGDINPSCRWDPDAYYQFNPNARAQQPRGALDHYKQIGMKNGLAFCKALGQYPLLEALFKTTELKKIVEPAPATEVARTCKPETISSGSATFQTNEVFLVAPDKEIESTQAVTTCAALGAKVATAAQVRDAQLNSAQWCNAGWVATAPSTGTIAQTIADKPVFPQSVAGGCVPGEARVYTGNVVNNRAAVNCFGVKPPRGTPTVQPFNSKAWSQNTQGAAQSIAKRWTCENRAFAEALFTGPPSAEETYLGRDDIVCFVNNAESKEILCRSVQEYKNGEDFTTQMTDTYELNCNKMSQALADLSGAMTTITNIKGSLDMGVLSLGGAATSLDNAHTKLTCKGSGSFTTEMRAMCNVLDASRQKVLASSQAINSTDPSKEGVMNAILAPMQQAETSRANIIETRRRLQCPTD